MRTTTPRLAGLPDAPVVDGVRGLVCLSDHEISATASATSFGLEYTVANTGPQDVPDKSPREDPTRAHGKGPTTAQGKSPQGP